MNITKIDEKNIETLNAYKKVDVCMIDGLEFPVMLRHMTLDAFVTDEIFGRECYNVSMKNSRHYNDYIEEFQVREPRNIIDAGGNIGLAAIFYAVKYPDAKIVTIEPDSDNFYFLCENIKPYSNIKAIRGAVWDQVTKLCITNRKNAVWDNGTLNAGKYIVGEDVIDGETYVPAYTIDNIIETYNMDKIDILKMDVEGAEREIFAGKHEKWLPQVKILILEHHDFYKPGATKSLFKALSNYDFHFMYDNSDSLETMMFLFDKH
jgi:FkbM family methyltransferase